MISSSYMAGFFDGEGSISIYPNGNGAFHLRTQLAQNVSPASIEVFKAFQEQYGGKQVSLSQRVKFNWQLDAQKAADFLSDIYEDLVIKKQQAAVAIYTIAHPERLTGDAYWLMKLLKTNNIAFTYDQNQILLEAGEYMQGGF